MMNALRLTGGFETKLFTERTGMPWQTVAMRVAEASRKGLIVQDVNKITPTIIGRRYLNDLLALFLND